MNIWDHAEVIDLTTGAASAGVATLSTTQISGITTGTVLAIAVDGNTATDITVTTATKDAIGLQIDNLSGVSAVYATSQVGTIVSTSATTGALSSVVISREATHGTALIAAANIATAATAATAFISTTQISAITTSQIAGLTATTVYIDNVANIITLSTTGTGGVTATTLATDLDALTGISAAAAANAVTVTFDAAGAGHAFGIDFIGSTFTDGANASGIVSGADILVYVNGGDAQVVTLSGATKATLAADLDALDDITAAVVSNDVVVTFGVIGSESTIAFDTLPVTVTPGVDRVVLASGTGVAADLGHTGDYTGLHVGVAGDVKLDLARVGTAITFKALPAGIYPLAFSRVHGSGTTATDLKGLRSSNDGMKT